MSAEKTNNFNQGLMVVPGLILLVIGVWLIWLWKWDVLTVIRGFSGSIIILAGVIFLAIKTK